MSINNVNTNSGSLYPDESLLNAQFNPKDKVTATIKVRKNEEGVVTLNQNAYVDLIRLSTLEVNGESIYNRGTGFPDGVEKAADKTQYVFQSLVDKLGSDSQAFQAAHLLQQNLGGGVLQLVAMKKGLSTRGQNNEVDSTHTVTAKRMYSAINTEDSRFTVIHEQLIATRSMEDPDRVSFFKIKTVVRGKIEALDKGDSGGMSTTVGYTKEYQTIEGALKANYWGTKAGGLSNTQSYIKS